MCGAFTGEHEVKIVIYSKPNCPYCTRAKALAEMKGESEPTVVAKEPEVQEVEYHDQDELPSAVDDAAEVMSETAKKEEEDS